MEGSFALTLSTVSRKQWDRTGQGTYLGPPHPQPKDTAVIKTLETREHLLQQHQNHPLWLQGGQPRLSIGRAFDSSAPRLRLYYKRSMISCSSSIIRMAVPIAIEVGFHSNQCHHKAFQIPSLGTLASTE